MALCSPQAVTEKRRSVEIEKYFCDLCYAHCSTAEMLAQHLLGNKHKRNLQAYRPQERKGEIRLNYFLKAYMEKEPIVGLEYIQEVKKDSLYTYSCQLCGLLICHLPTIVDHLIDPSHIESYIKKHFLYLFPQFSKPPTKRDYLKGLRDAAVRILELKGNKKEIQDVLPESDGKISGASEDTPPSKPESGNFFHSKLSPLQYQETGLDESRESFRYNKMLQKSSNNDPPLAKRSRRSLGSDQDALPSTLHNSKHGSSHYNDSHAIKMDCTATQELEFRTNDEFLEYFANFVISDDEDVLFIRTITQNCLKALTSFQEEDAERQKTGHQPEAPLEDTNEAANLIFNRINVIVNPRKNKNQKKERKRKKTYKKKA